MTSARPVQSQPSVTTMRSARYEAIAPSAPSGYHQSTAARTRPGHDQAYAPSSRSGQHPSSASQGMTRIPHPNGDGRPDLVIVDGIAYEWTDDDAASAQANSSLTPAEQQRIAYLDNLGPQGGSSGFGGAPPQQGGMHPSGYGSSSRNSGHRPSLQPAAEYYPPTREPDARPSRQPTASETRRPGSRHPESRPSRHLEHHSSLHLTHRSSRHPTAPQVPRPPHHHSSSHLLSMPTSSNLVFPPRHPTAPPQLGPNPHGVTRTSSRRRPTGESGSHRSHYGGSRDDRRGGGGSWLLVPWTRCEISIYRELYATD
jgi:hypothetical protein